MFKRWVIAAFSVLLAFAFATLGISLQKNDRPPSHRVQPGSLIVIAMPGLTWSDISSDTTPVLADLAHNSAVGNQLVRSISAHSCSSAAWATLGAGTRTPLGYSPPAAPSSGTNAYCPEVPTGIANNTDHTYFFPQWKTWSRDAARRNIPSKMGLVASTLEKGGQCITAVGPDAAVGAANRQGKVSHYYPAVSEAALNACAVTLVSTTGRSDVALGRVLRDAPKDATFLITGLTDDERPESPRAVMVSGPTVSSGLLRSRSTRQPGLVQTTDLSAFILERTPHPPTLGEGRALSVEGHSPDSSLRAVYNQQRLLRTQHDLIQPFFLRIGIATVIALLIGIVLTLLGRHTSVLYSRQTPRRWWAFVAGVFGAIPASTFLANLYAWYLHPNPLWWLLGATLAFAIPISIIAVSGPWKRWSPGPAVFLAAFTLLTLCLDVVQGSPLQLVSVFGLQPVYGGRFYGMGNVGYSMLMTSGLFVAAMLGGRYRALKRPRIAALTVVAICGPALLINGVPQWGNEGGGSAAFIPAFIYLVMRARGMRITLTRIAVVLAATATVVLTAAGADYLRGPANRTHLGDLFAGLLDGHIGPIKRILYTNWNMLTSSWMYMIVPIVLVVSVLMVSFPQRFGRFLEPLFVRVPMLRHGLIAIIMMWVLGFLANDSGTSIPGVGAMIAVPLVILTGCGLAAPHASEAPTDPLEVKAAKAAQKERL